MKRRHLLKFLFLLNPTVWAMGFKNFFTKKKEKTLGTVILDKADIDFQWPTLEPFLFCVHHYDYYPQGNSNNGLDSKHFQGRQMGSDFQLKDGFRLYHGSEIPGFPVHPHRGFETITIVRKGYVDHADSLGAAGRYGEGDVQWMTAGAGVQHSEMFPLLHKDKENTLELFQIWLNLPKSKKMVPADFKMLWSEGIPKIQEKNLEVTLISGEYKDKKYYEAPQNSWANLKENNVNILLVKIDKGALFEFPKSSTMTNRMLYSFEGEELLINEEKVQGKMAVRLDSGFDLKISSSGQAEFLILEAKPIGEPVVQLGPFVMNSKEEIAQTFQDYHKTQFGGWPWKRNDMIHGDKIERFAKYPNGKTERPS